MNDRSLDLDCFSSSIFEYACLDRSIQGKPFGERVAHPSLRLRSPAAAALRPRRIAH